MSFSFGFQQRNHFIKVSKRLFDIPDILQQKKGPKTFRSFRMFLVNERQTAVVYFIPLNRNVLTCQRHGTFKLKVSVISVASARTPKKKIPGRFCSPSAKRIGSKHELPSEPTKMSKRKCISFSLTHHCFKKPANTCTIPQGGSRILNLGRTQ